jgi:protoporphyrin/coproporphyrin ferrochelatase
MLPPGPLPTGHPAVNIGKIGVLLVNLGTPEATGYWPMRRYLKEFLSDRRVIEVNRVGWWFLLNAIILSTRPQKSGKAYDKIWNREKNESPLKTISRGQAEKLSARFEGQPEVVVDWAMRYGMPSTPDKLKNLKDQGCDRILLVPLYPQYSAATTAAIRTLPPYHDDPAHIDALAESLESHLKSIDFEPDRILASFHGLPQSYFDAGDPYHCHCMKTARLLREKLKLPKEKLQVVFQSRFGKAEWLKPYALDTVKALPGDHAGFFRRLRGNP